MSSDMRLAGLARHGLIRLWLIFFAGLYLLGVHVLWASGACLASLCLPPSRIVPPSPAVVAWADLAVAVIYLGIGGKGLLRPSSGAKDG